ncbi:site-specific integrase [Rhizobium ruizarguesonis]|uniref:site-specific integrase n=1 Tax=Rhizobium ruizarguesonis TaxID=2081791 RepID=UPI001030E60A|nr:site-specific integrase [Rhizobium ruizarguesonis]TBC80942.1 site-specific integrase [Rhizobium ruizarguesonis]
MLVEISSSNDTRIYHDYVMGRLPHRRWLKGGRFENDRWVIETQNPDTMRLTSRTISFDALLTPMPYQKRLNDAGLENDLITAKLLVFYSLEPAPVGWNESASSVDIDFKKFLVFLQWRYDRGIPNNRALTGGWHREFEQSLKENGREGLLRLSSRVDTLVSMYRADEIDIPLKAGHRSASPQKIAELLGIYGARSLTPEARRVLDKFLLSAGVAGKAVIARLNREGLDDEDDEAKANGNTVYKMLFVWFALWKLRGKLTHDPIGVKAYNSPRHIYKSIRGWTKRCDPWPDPPSYQASWLINSALTLILDDATTHLLNLAEARARNNTERAHQQLIKANQRLQKLGAEEITPNVASRVRQDRTGLRYAIYEILVAACVIVIAAFSARRKNEIFALKVGCIELDPNGAVWLHSLILKNKKDVDRIPVPKSVQVAVSILERLREIGETPADNWLLQFNCVFTGQLIDVDINACLTSFAAWCETPPLPDGTKWNFSAHQLRKFFGITYFWRYMYPNLAALSLQYRHFNPETTMGYISSRSRSTIKLWDERQAAEQRRSATERATVERLVVVESSRLQFTKDILQSVAEGAVLSGPLGRLLTDEIDALKKQFASEVHITGATGAPATFLDALAGLAKERMLRVHKEGHSLCGLGQNPADNAHASCLKLKSEVTGIPTAVFDGPDFTFADEGGCLVCPHRAGLPVLAPFWDREVASALASLREANDEHLVYVEQRVKLLNTHAGA